MMWILGSMIVLIVFLLLSGIKIIPQQEAWVVERFGKYQQTNEAGIHFVIPFVEKVAYKHSLKEVAIDVHEQTAITKDNVSIKIDGILYLKIIDPKGASYGALNPRFALTQLAQTTLRSEIGKIHLDRTFEEREHLNEQVVKVLNQAAGSWGIVCLRYEIKDITMPHDVQRAMELQVTAERQKRARILESEGLRQAAINDSEGSRQSNINKAQGEAEGIEIVATATKKALQIVSEAISSQEGVRALEYKLAERYIDTFGKLAKESTTWMLPSDVADPRNFLAQAVSILNTKKASGMHVVATEK